VLQDSTGGVGNDHSLDEQSATMSAISPVELRTIAQTHPAPTLGTPLNRQVKHIQIPITLTSLMSHMRHQTGRGTRNDFTLSPTPRAFERPWISHFFHRSFWCFRIGRSVGNDLFLGERVRDNGGYSGGTTGPGSWSMISRVRRTTPLPVEGLILMSAAKRYVSTHRPELKTMRGAMNCQRHR